MLADAVDAGLDDGELPQKDWSAPALPARPCDRGTAGRHAAVSRAGSGGSRAWTQLHRARSRRPRPPFPAVHPARRSLHAARSASRLRWPAVPFDRRKSCSAAMRFASGIERSRSSQSRSPTLTDPGQEPRSANHADQLPRAGAGQRQAAVSDLRASRCCCKSQSQIEVGEKPEIRSGCLQGQGRVRRPGRLGPASTCFRRRSATARCPAFSCTRAWPTASCRTGSCAPAPRWTAVAATVGAARSSSV